MQLVLDIDDDDDASASVDSGASTSTAHALIACSKRASRSSFAMHPPFLVPCVSVHLGPCAEGDDASTDGGRSAASPTVHSSREEYLLVCGKTGRLWLPDISHPPFFLCQSTIGGEVGRALHVVFQTACSGKWLVQIAFTSAELQYNTEVELCALQDKCGCGGCKRERSGRSSGKARGEVRQIEDRIRHLYRGSQMPSPPAWMGDLRDRMSMKLRHGALLMQCRRRNSVSTAQTDRLKSEGAAMQTPKLEDGRVSRAAGAACATILATRAFARWIIRKEHGENVYWDGFIAVPATATHAIEPASKSHPFLLVDSAALPFDCTASQLGEGGAAASGVRLARLELEEGAITQLCLGVCSQWTTALETICHASLVGADDEVISSSIDSKWAAIGVLCFVASLPKAEELLRKVQATHLHIEVARALATYAFAEAQRRSHQTGKKRRRSTDCESNDAPASIDARSGSMRRGDFLQNWIDVMGDKFGYVFENMLCSDQLGAEMASVVNLKVQTTESGNASTIVSNDSVQRAARHQAGVLYEMSERLLNGIRAPRFTAMRGLLPATDASHRGDSVRSSLEWHGLPARQHAGVLDIMPGSTDHVVMHACVIPSHAAPLRQTGIYLTHSIASRHVFAASELKRTIGRSEAHAFLAAAVKASTLSLRNTQKIRRLTGNSGQATCAPVISGRLRTWVQRMQWMPLDAQRQLDAARRMSADAMAMLSVERLAADDGQELCNAALPIRHAPLTHYEGAEPVNPIHNPIALHLRMSDRMFVESLGQRWRPRHEVRTRMCNADSRTSASANTDTVDNFAPLPVAVTCSVHFDVCSVAREMTSTSFQLACHLGKRTVDVLRQAMRAEGASVSADWSSVVAAAASVASEVSDRAHVLSQQAAMHNINRTHRINVPDMSLRTLHTAYDCIAAFSTNMSPICKGTQYEGHYMCIDHGRVPPGLTGGNDKPDDRRHGKSAASDAALAAAAALYAQHKDAHPKEQRPEECKGEPHRLLVGVHASMQSLHRGMGLLRRHGWSNDPNEDDTRGCMLRLLVPATVPLSQQADVGCEMDADVLVNAQQMRVDAEERMRMRMLPLPDGTTEEASLLRAPLFPPPSRVAWHANVFESTTAYGEVFFQAASHIAMLASLLLSASPIESTMADADNATAAVDELHRLLCQWHERPTEAIEGNAAVVVAHVLVLLHVLYPYTVGINQPVIRPVCSAAPRHVHTFTSGPRLSLQGCAQSLPDQTDDGLSVSRHVTTQQAWWSAFCRTDKTRCAWHAGLRPLLRRLAAMDGAAVQSRQEMEALRADFELAVRAVWLVNSRDGVEPPEVRYAVHSDGTTAPYGADLPCMQGRQSQQSACAVMTHPLGRASGPTSVIFSHISPVFVRRTATRNAPPCRSPIGIIGFQYRHVLTMLIGARLLGPAGVDLAGQEGQLLVRLSSNALVKNVDGSSRSVKATSPVSQDRDEAVFGEAHAKREVCKLSMDAFDHCLKTTLPLYLALQDPLPLEERKLGGKEVGRTVRDDIAKAREQGNMQGPARSHDELFLEKAFLAACSNVVACEKAHAALMKAAQDG